MAKQQNKFVMIWKVKNFSLSWQSGGKAIFSPQFQPENIRGTKWRLKLSPMVGETTNCICVQLLREEADDGPRVVDIRFELSLQSCDESPLKFKEFSGRFKCGNISSGLSVKRNEVLFHNIEKYLPEDTLTVCCTMLHESDSVSRTGRYTAQTVIGIAHLSFSGKLIGFSSLFPNVVRAVQCDSESLELRSVIMMISLNEQGVIRIIRRGLFSDLQLRSSKLYLIDNAENKVECIQESKWDDISINCNFSLPFTQKYMTDKKELFAPRDILTFQYKVTLSPGIEFEEIGKVNYALDDCQNIPEISKNEGNMKNTSKDIEDQGEGVQPTTFKDDMISFHSDSLFYDVKLRIGTETVPAHRDILRARSPVFKKMFDNDMKEKSSECIDIMDLNLDTVKRMLLFLYTDNIEELGMQSAKELYFASDKYDISSLKQRCSVFMKQNLQPENVFEILVLADMHQDDNLKFAVQQYILKLDQKIFTSHEWKSFMESNISLAAQVMYLKCLKN